MMSANVQRLNWFRIRIFVFICVYLWISANSTHEIRATRILLFFIRVRVKTNEWILNIEYVKTGNERAFAHTESNRWKITSAMKHKRME